MGTDAQGPGTRPFCILFGLHITFYQIKATQLFQAFINQYPSAIPIFVNLAFSILGTAAGTI
jgi:hypothetical protein